MPRYDFQCSACQNIHEHITPSNIIGLPSVCCGVEAGRLLSAPSTPRMGGTRTYSEAQMQKIKEPVWTNPDGSVDV